MNLWVNHVILSTIVCIIIALLCVSIWMATFEESAVQILGLTFVVAVGIVGFCITGTILYDRSRINNVQIDTSEPPSYVSVAPTYLECPPPHYESVVITN